MIRSPYPFFGGKSTIASEIWRRFGNVPNLIDPFFGSSALLLSRPHQQDLELVNDSDGLIVNFWRAVQADAQAVAEHADYPAFESDLHARHAWLVGRKERLRAKLEGDPDYYDAKIAGWWVWGMSLWIGSGFCSGKGRWRVVEGELVVTDGNDAPLGIARQFPKTVDRSLRSKSIQDGTAVAGQLPYLSRPLGGVNAGAIVGQSPRLSAWQGISAGVARQLPRTSEFVGVKRNRLELAGSPKGVFRKMPEMVSARGDASRRARGLYAYFDALQARFRRVRVTCGDWTRVITPAVLGAKSPCAVLLDPPYLHDDRETGLYASDEPQVYQAVRAWALANGDNPALRIAYCCYEDGFEFPAGWTRLNWKANGGYSNQGDGMRQANASREVVWFSPNCLPVEQQMTMFHEDAP